MRAPSRPGDEQNGGWSHAQLTRMDSDFVAAMERPIAAGKESRQAATHDAKETRPR